MDNEQKEFETEEETREQAQNEEIETKEKKENAAERLNSYLFAMGSLNSDENGNPKNPETEHNKDPEKTKKLLLRLCALAVGFAVAFCGAFAG